ncbi:hypothetical protein BJV77DRAFT_958231, partial [Russula vinacea]
MLDKENKGHNQRQSPQMILDEADEGATGACFDMRLRPGSGCWKSWGRWRIRFELRRLRGSSFFPPNDPATYRDLLLFEERLKTNALILNRRKSRYQFFLVQLIFAIIFLLCEVLLHTPFLSVPYQYLLRRAFPNIYGSDVE